MKGIIKQVVQNYRNFSYKSQSLLYTISDLFLYTMEMNMARMTVYHGGYVAVERPEIRIGRNTKDFGNGFYCTIIKEQAQRWAKRYDTKVVSIYDVCMDANLRIKEFKEMTEQIAFCTESALKCLEYRECEVL